MGVRLKLAQLPNGVKVINYTCPVDVKPPINKPLPKNCAVVPVINTRTPMTKTTMVVCKPPAKK